MSTVSFGAAGAGRGRAARWPGMAVAAVLGALLAALGATLLAKAPWGEARTHLAVRSWPVAEARVLSVSLAEEHRLDQRGRLAAELVLSVTYQFDIAGETFTSRRASLSDRAEPHDRQLMTLYRRLNFARLTGRAVPASYDPRDPAHAYLDTGFAWKPALLRAGSGLAAVALGLVLMTGGFRRGDKASSL